MMGVVYVITWRYSDGSGSGAVSVHQTEASALAMLEILHEHADMKQFAMQAVPSDSGEPGERNE